MTLLNDQTIDEVKFHEEEIDQEFCALSPYEQKVLSLQTIQEQLYRLRNASSSPANSFKTSILEARERAVERELQAMAELGEDYDD